MAGMKKPKATFLIYLAINKDHVTMIPPHRDSKLGCSPPFTSEKRATKFLAKVLRAWHKGGFTGVTGGIIRIEAELPPMSGTWNALKKHGIREVKA